VHNPTVDSSRAKKRIKTSQNGDGGSDKRAVVPAGRAGASAANDLELVTSGSESEDERSESNFASELDIALDRNASEIFSFFHREIWHMVRSLPEVLHHATKIVDLLYAVTETAHRCRQMEKKTLMLIVLAHSNHATTDILHLLAVLARFIRNSSFLRRLFPGLSMICSARATSSECGKQRPLDVGLVEIS
jgi:hypothetical protein